MPESISGEAKDFLTLMLQYNPDKRISAKVTSSFLMDSSSEIWTVRVLRIRIDSMQSRIRMQLFISMRIRIQGAKQMQIPADLNSDHTLKSQKVELFHEK
jgi:hypothetical protein